MRASAPLNAALKEGEESHKITQPVAEPPQPIPSSGFTPVNAGGWTPVNLTPASFQAVNGPSPLHKREPENGFPNLPGHAPNGNLVPPSKDVPDYLNAAPLTNGHTSNPLKRTISHDSLNGTSGTESGVGGEGDDQNERRSKRVKKGMKQNQVDKLILIPVAAPTVVGSHMSLLRPATTTFPGDRRKGKPGGVSSSI